MRGWLAAVALLAAWTVARGASGAVPSSGAEPLYFGRNSRQVALLDSSRSRLFVFGPDADLEQAFSGPALAHFCGDQTAVWSSPRVESGTVVRCAGRTLVLEQLKERPAKPHLTVDQLTDPDTVAASRRYWRERQNTSRVYPFSPVDILADGVPEALVWAATFVQNHWGPVHEFPVWSGNQTGLFYMGDGLPLRRTGSVPEARRADPSQEIRLGLSADWGAGTQEAAYVSQLIAAFDPHYTVHVGDVYLLGTTDEVASNVLGQVPAGAQVGVSWPRGSQRTFALNGNHEMYSRGYGYFDLLLPALDQQASFFQLENEYWRVIGLDTGYNSYSVLINAPDQALRPELVDWLTNVAKLGDPSDTRGVVFLSHHQYRSAFDTQFNATAQQLAALVPPGRDVVWLWGHEHRLAVYELGSADGIELSAYGRCIGVGGFPVSLGGVPPDALAAGLEAYDDRQMSTVEGLFDIPVGFNGFTQLTFTGANMTVEYRSLELGPDGALSNTSSTLLMTETFLANLDSGSVERVMFAVEDANITVVQH